jgi:hypothetical protein
VQAGNGVKKVEPKTKKLFLSTRINIVKRLRSGQGHWQLRAPRVQAGDTQQWQQNSSAAALSSGF